MVDITVPPSFTLVLLIFPGLRGSPEESLTGVAVDPSVVHVSHGKIPANLAVVNWLQGTGLTLLYSYICNACLGFVICKRTDVTELHIIYYSHNKGPTLSNKKIVVPDTPVGWSWRTSLW